MSTFALHEFESVRGFIPFRKLVVDGVCVFDEFCTQIELEGNLKKQLVGIIANMEQVAALKRLPKEKFRDITPPKEAVKEFELKKGDLRVYLIKEQGHIVILGGKKNSQKDDIRQFRALKRRYLESKKKNV